MVSIEIPPPLRRYLDCLKELTRPLKLLLLLLTLTSPLHIRVLAIYRHQSGRPAGRPSVKYWPATRQRYWVLHISRRGSLLDTCRSVVVDEYSAGRRAVSVVLFTISAPWLFGGVQVLRLRSGQSFWTERPLNGRPKRASGLVIVASWPPPPPPRCLIYGPPIERMGHFHSSGGGGADLLMRAPDKKVITGPILLLPLSKRPRWMRHLVLLRPAAICADHWATRWSLKEEEGPAKQFQSFTTKTDVIFWLQKGAAGRRRRRRRHKGFAQ